MLQSYDIPGTVEAGTDEAGRGCIAGPVYAAAVILPADFHDPGLNFTTPDSMTPNNCRDAKGNA